MKCDYNFVSSKSRKTFRDSYLEDLKIQTALGVHRYDDAFVLPYEFEKGEGGVVDSNLKFISNTTLNEEFTDGVYRFNRDQVRYTERNVIFLGTIASIYGHAITDNLKKVWFLNTADGKKLIDSGAQIVYITFQGKEKSHL